MKQSLDELYNTMYIKETIEEYIKNPNEQTEADVMVHLIMRLLEDGKAPIAFMNQIVFDLDPDKEIEDVFTDDMEEDEIFIVIEGDDGRNWIPLYTDMKELNGIEKTNAVKEVPIRNIIERAIGAPGIDGILINPETDKFAILKPGLEFLIDKTDELEDMSDEDAG